MKNTLKKVTMTVLAFALLVGALSVPAQQAQASAKELTKNDVTKIKAKKGTVNPLKKYKKYTYAGAFYTKNNKNFKGTLRGIKINSTLKQVKKKYGKDIYLNDITKNTPVAKAEKQVLKKMKVSGATKCCNLGISDNKSNFLQLTIYFNKGNKVKAVVIGKNYSSLIDGIVPDNGGISFKTKGNIVYAK